MTEQATKRKSGVRFIDPKTEKELEVQFIYQRSERMVHAILHDAENRPAPGGWLAVLATGVALCSKHDQFVKRKGRAIALARLIESGYPNDRAARKAIWKQILDGGFRVA